MAGITLAGLSRMAVEYNDVLASLPLNELNKVCKTLRINLLEVENEDKEVRRRRKAGILGAYKVGKDLNHVTELGKLIEMSLKPELVYSSFIDNITSYREKKVLSNQGEMLDNKTKKHPLESMILRDIVLSFMEDVAVNLFFADRDDSLNTPATAFDGFFTKLGALSLAGKIAVGEGNYGVTGAITAPTTETDVEAYGKIVEFIGSSNPFLLQGETLLYIPLSAVSAMRNAYKNKVKSFVDPTMGQVLEALRADTFCPGLQIITDPVLGTGSKLILTKPGNMDIGMAPNKAEQFVQVRDPKLDPNDVQFWIQTAFDTRVKDVHQKVFKTNDGTSTASAVAGDY